MRKLRKGERYALFLGGLLYITTPYILLGQETTKRDTTVSASRADTNIRSLDIEEVEVFSTGYQKISKERATGSFEFVDRERLQKRISGNVLERLDGLVPSIQFDSRTGSSLINIRGINTLTSDLMGPLIVLDNFPYEGDIGNINPNDIESVTLLKDAAAASIWGARAGNGVIVITTKKASSKVRFSATASANSSLADKPDLYYQKNIRSSDFIDVERMLFEEGFYDAAYNAAQATRRKSVFSPVIDLLYQAKSGKITSGEAERQIDGYRSHDYRDDLLRYHYLRSFSQRYYTSLNSSTDRLALAFSAGFDHNNGNMTYSSDRRFSLRNSTEWRPSERFRAGLILEYTRQASSRSLDASEYPIRPGGGKTVLYPYAHLMGDEGPLAVPYKFDMTYIDGLVSEPLLDWYYYPLKMDPNSISREELAHVAANVNMDWTVLSGLKIGIQYGYEQQSNDGLDMYGVESYFARDLINLYTQVVDGNPKYIIPKGDIANLSSSGVESHRVRGQLEFAHRFEGGHALHIFGGTELSSALRDGYIQRVYGFNPDVLTFTNVDYVNTYPIYDRLQSNSRIPAVGGFSKGMTRFVSMFANGSYTYREKYIVNFSVRRDASNLFGRRTNDLWNPLWSSGIAWQAHREDFLREAVWLSSLRFRATLGHSGNTRGGGAYETIINYISNASWTNFPYAIISDLPNEKLRWEDVRMANLGVDFGLWDNRVRGTFEYFAKKSSDLISVSPIDHTMGMSSMRRNVAELSGKGFDAKINIRAIRDSKLQWDIDASLSYSRNKVAKFYGTVASMNTYVLNAGQAMHPLLGRELYPVFSYRWAGLDPLTGDPQGYYRGEVSKDYSVMLNDSLQYLDYHGTALPPYYGFIQNTFRYGPLQFSFNVQFKFGHYFQKETISYTGLFNGWSSHSDFYERWQSSGDENRTTIPSMVYPANSSRDAFYARSTANIIKGDLIRLRDVRLDYHIPIGLRQKSPIRCNVFLSIDRAGLLWTANDDGIDTDYQDMPPSRSYSIGVTFNY